jgi:hypothetical protein
MQPTHCGGNRFCAVFEPRYAVLVKATSLGAIFAVMEFPLAMIRFRNNEVPKPSVGAFVTDFIAIAEKFIPLALADRFQRGYDSRDV